MSALSEIRKATEQLPRLRFRPFFWWHRDTAIAEVISAVLAWYWGFVLLLPVDTFVLSASYSGMAMLAPEWVWGCAFLFIGLLQSMAMCGNARLFRYPSALLAMALWFFAAGLFLYSNPATHAPGVYGFLGLTQAWVIIRGPQRDE